MQGKVENRVVATGTITTGTRIPLGRSVLRILGAEVGDFFEIYLDHHTGRLYLDKVRAPPQNSAEDCQNA
jgi:hypothetical protein